MNAGGDGNASLIGSFTCVMLGLIRERYSLKYVHKFGELMSEWELSGFEGRKLHQMKKSTGSTDGLSNFIVKQKREIRLEGPRSEGGTSQPCLQNLLGKAPEESGGLRALYS